MGINVHGDTDVSMSKTMLYCLGSTPASIMAVAQLCRYGITNDKRKKPLPFSRGLSVCRHYSIPFFKLKCDEKIIEKGRLFH